MLAVALLAAASCALLPRHRDTAVPTDLNRGSLRTLEGLPGVTPTMARRIVEGRPYRDREELVARGILTERELARISDRVTVADH